MFTKSVPEGPVLLIHSQISDRTDKEQADGYAMREKMMFEWKSQWNPSSTDQHK